MKRDDSEFSAYLAARWPALVRTLVLLGHSGHDAHAIAREGLVRVFPDWSRLRREEDVDVAVYREVLDARERHLRHAGEASSTVESAPVVPPGLAEQAERREQIEAALAAMSGDERMLVVLEYVAELSEDQVADVLEQPAGPVARLADDDVRLALAAVPVDPLRVEDVAGPARARRRRLWTRTLGAGAALLLVVVGVAWVVDRGDSQGEVAVAENPLPFAWYADGTLHLAEVTVEVRPVEDLVTVPGGVVMSDDLGAVTLVDDSGEIEMIGETVPGTTVVVEPDNGWVAWADPGEGDPELVVHDTRVGEEVGRRSLSAAGEGGGQPVGDNGPIAIDDEQVYYTTRGTTFVWEPLPDTAFSVFGDLVDIADGARLSNGPGGYRVQPQPFVGGSDIAGTEGRLTTDGRYAFVVENQEVVVYDVDTGQPLERMYSPSDRALGWTHTGDAFYFAVLHKLQDKTYQDMLQMPSEGNYRIFECVPGRDDVCIQRAEVSGDVPDPPILAR